MTPKTALQELIDQCKEARVYITGFKGEFYEGQRAIYDIVIESATELLPQERQQIIDAVWYGRTNHDDICSNQDAKTYYNNTFNKEQ
jgi:UDP-2,3-diacylglucosamine pyrophosphatase LpxH